MKHYINAVTPFCEERDELADEKRELCRDIRNGDLVRAQLSFNCIISKENVLIGRGKLKPEDMTV